MLRRQFLRWSTLAIASAALPLPVFARDEYQVDPRLGHMLGPISYAFQSDRAEIDPDILRDYLPPLGSGRTYYIDPESGEDDEDGSNWRRALRTVSAALDKPDVDRVIVRGDFVYRIDKEGQEGLGVYSGKRNVSIVADGGKAIFTTARKADWDSPWFGPNTHIYQSSPTGGQIVKVLDVSRLDEFGEYSEISQASTLEECQATPGTWAYWHGRVHLNHPHEPGDEVLLLRSTAMGVAAKNVIVHLKNIHFVGGSNGAFSDVGATGSVIYTEDCKFTHNWQTDGFKIVDAKLAISVRCVAAVNAKDGFNYHIGESTSPHFVELDCEGYGNRAPATGNGSSSHNSCVGLRINGSYHHNAGPGVADVNDAQSYNIACNSHHNGPGANSNGFLASSGDRLGRGARMWLDRCTAGANSGHDVFASNGATIEYRGLSTDDSEVFADSNSLAASFG